jgi:hypothetical protein
LDVIPVDEIPILMFPISRPREIVRRAASRWVWMPLSCFSTALVAVNWWLTAPPGPVAAPCAAERAVASRAWGTGCEGKTRGRDFPDWPEGRLEGEAAKRLLLEMLLRVQERLGKVDAYTATLRKQERINGVLGPEQTLAMKLRHRPFAVYLKYLAPKAGKEVVYAEGRHENKIIAHGVGLARLLVPRMAVPLEHPLAMAENRHAITEAGLASLTDRLVGFRQMDLDDPQAVTVLDWTTDTQGRPWLRSLHTHRHFDPSRPFARVEVLYDPQSRLPLQIRNEDWPQPGHEGELLLAERYIYENLDLDADLTPLDFDPSNPAYAFHRN